METKILDKTDTERILFLEKLCFSEHAWTEKMIESHLSSFGGIGLNDVGYVLYKVAGDEVEIYRIAVDPSRRRKGYGKELLDRLSELESEKTFFLEVASQNSAAIGLYESCGFQKIHVRKRYYEDGSDAWIFKKTPPEASTISNFEA
ncbi:ribosomal-protein-alanine N-acetyltransferase [Leptospira gomenensis]|uniref:[Ribosomal protein bS18]-alanine N-acetyltransferase n=1 Tax=Leptospira gomenensis TaxID=2484974 RepID=A0A5F1YKC2_9LEPT|nr:ribosomal protein S18-alanine N-acetyltransferase [Leptospira gomenensis]TGK34373.1 ribosomal-protein-alanine N-acetyltransferase [Leptospira gomenensis]TGK37267.1 ribosomal-protein-alanine N-acetyltransferase [Leptospira gomenensis]TGK50954.1 ribosomal-protein-alanine N-acetyltransferase [Leptospira gomenensis]TGK56576.1 ribosomal-protein-alanine N-acetyltransferase [Leptospira gomenensis]